MTGRVVAPAQWRTAAAALQQDGFTWFCLLDGTDAIGRADAITVTLRVVAVDGSAADLETDVPRAGGELDSLRALWPAAGWAERGVAEAFGIRFAGGDDRPLLLHGGPEAPLRKEVLLPRRQEPWPGAKEDPTEGGRARRRLVPVGVPDPAAVDSADIVASAYGTGRRRR